MCPEFLEIRPSTIDGVGVFTSRAISGGEVFYNIPMAVIFDHPVSHCAKIGKNLWVHDKDVLNFINHSCDPNIFLDTSTPQFRLIALRAIKEGEELVCNYDRSEIDGKRIACNCGSENCRGYFLRVE